MDPYDPPPAIPPHESKRQKFSTYVKRASGRVAENKIREYEAYIDGLDMNSAENKDFLRDYLITMRELKQGLENQITQRSVESDRADLEESFSSAVTAPSIDLNKLVIKPTTFNGITPPPREWLSKYKNAILANNWSHEVAARYFRHFLTDSASRWFETELANFRKPSWQQIEFEFESNYLGKANYNSLCRELETKYQKFGELVSTFIPDYRYLLLQVAPDTSESDQVRQITSKLLNVYRNKLALFVPSSVREMKDICLRVESTFSNVSKGHAPLNKILPNNQNRRRDQGNDKPKTCHHCGREGHIVSECFATKHKNGQPLVQKNKPPAKAIKPNSGYVNKNVNNINKNEDNKCKVASTKKSINAQSNNLEVECKTLSRFNRSQPIKTSQCNAISPNSLLTGITLDVKFDGIEIKCLVDPGAGSTVMNAQLAKELGFKLLPKPKLMKLTGPNAQQLYIPAVIKVNVEITLHGISKSKLAMIPIVSNLQQNVLLGMDLLKHFKLMLDSELGTVSFKYTGIVTEQEQIVPARSQCFIQALADHKGTILTTQSGNLGTDGIVTANTINVATPKTQILVLNPTNRNVILPPGKQISTFEKLDAGETQINNVLQLKGCEEITHVGENLSPSQRKDVIRLLEKNIRAFSINGRLGVTNIIEHKIDLVEGTKPFASALRRRPPLHVEETHKQIAEMRKTGLIEDSCSPWASAYVLAKKKNGEFRLCIDYRKLNDATKKDVYPLPNIEDCLDSLSGKKYFSLLDFNSGFWQIKMAKEAKELTAFRTEDGHFQFTRMPFGLTNAPASFQKMVNALLAGLKGLNLQVFIDDVCVATNGWHEHIDMLQKVFTLVIKANLTLKPEKCLFGANRVTFLGHEISEAGIKQDPNKMRAMNELPAPTDVPGVRRVMGMFSYYRKFVPNFAAIASPITQLLRKGEEFNWGDKQQEAFDKIKEILARNATLFHFNHEDPIMVKTDASHKGIAGMLLQRHDGLWKLVYCCSRRLSAAEENYGITNLEGLAIVYTLQKLRPYLLGKKFVISTDHCALCVLNKDVDATKSNRLQRWRIALSEFDYKIEYTKGNLHKDIDCLSRAPIDNATDTFLEGKVYHVALPLDRTGWIDCYSDNESETFLTKAENEIDGFSLLGGVIYNDNLLFVPESKRCEILSEAHSSPTSGHGGLEVTLARMERYWWPNMKDDTRDWIKSCDECQRRKIERIRPPGSMYHFQAYAPLELVCLDTIGPLPQTTLNNMHILVAIDAFTRFVEAEAVPDTTAATCLDFLNRYCGRYGVPQTILTDGGPMFNNLLLKEAFKVFGIAPRRTTPEHSQGNAIVERVNQTLQDKLAMNLGGVDINWDVKIPPVVLSINTSKHASTGYSPYELLFGRKLPVYNQEVFEETTPHDVHLKLIQHELKSVREHAINNQAAAKEKSRKNFERLHRVANYDVGDRVLIRIGGNRPSKLQNRYGGPFEIISKTDDIYKLKNPNTNKTLERHVSSIKPYYESRALSPTPSITSTLSTIITTMITILCMITTINCSAMLDTVNPVLWVRTDNYVQAGLEFYDINLGVVNPCFQIKQLLKTNRTVQRNKREYIRHANRMIPFFNKTEVNNQEQNRIVRDTPLVEPKPVPVIFDVEDSRKKVLSEEEMRCNDIFDEYWTKKIEELNRIEPVQPEYSHRTFNDIEQTRVKRGIMNLLKMAGFGNIGVMALEAIGFIAANIVTNFVSSLFEKVNPGKETKVVVEHMEKKMELFRQSQNINRNITQAMIDQLEITNNRITELIHEHEQDFNALKRAQWVIPMIIGEIKEASSHLTEVIDEYREGRVATHDLSRLLKLPDIRSIPKEDTYFYNATLLADGIVKLRFSLIRASKDTHVYHVKAFNHWDNIANTNLSPPRLLTYRGPEWIVYNSSSHCVAVVERPYTKGIQSECKIENGYDKKLQRWDPAPVQPNFSTYNEANVYKTMEYNYVQCYGNKISLRNEMITCPLDLIRIPADKSFEISDHFYYSPRVMDRNVTHNFVMEAIHSKQYNENNDRQGNDVKYIKTIMNLKEMLKKQIQMENETTTKIEQELVITRESLIKCTALGSVIGLLCGLVIYCYITRSHSRIVRFCSSLCECLVRPTNNRENRGSAPRVSISSTRALRGEEHEMAPLDRPFYPRVANDPVPPIPGRPPGSGEPHSYVFQRGDVSRY